MTNLCNCKRKLPFMCKKYLPQVFLTYCWPTTCLCGTDEYCKPSFFVISNCLIFLNNGHFVLEIIHWNKSIILLHYRIKTFYHFLQPKYLKKIMKEINDIRIWNDICANSIFVVHKLYLCIIYLQGRMFVCWRVWVYVKE